MKVYELMKELASMPARAEVSASPSAGKGESIDADSVDEVPGMGHLGGLRQGRAPVIAYGQYKGRRHDAAQPVFREANRAPIDGRGAASAWS